MGGIRDEVNGGRLLETLLENQLVEQKAAVMARDAMAAQ